MDILLVIGYVVLSWWALGYMQSLLGVITFSTFTYRVILSMILGWILIPVCLMIIVFRSIFIKNK